MQVFLYTAETPIAALNVSKMGLQYSQFYFISSVISQRSDLMKQSMETQMGLSECIFHYCFIHIFLMTPLLR